MSQLAISAEFRLIAANRVSEVLHICQSWLGGLASRIILWGRSDCRDGKDSDPHRDLEVHQQSSTAIGQSIGSAERITSVPPKVFEPVRRQLRIANRMLDVLV